MTSYQSPTGTYPLVFESGVINIDENGVLHFHLSHSEDHPHPMLTHPEGGESFIPSGVSEVELTGHEQETVKIRCGLTETDTLPTGFVFSIKGWKLVQVEMSGDVTIVMGGMDAVPNWFQPGKIHRFDGPEDGVKLYSGSRPLVEKINTPRTTAPKFSSTPSQSRAQEAKKSSPRPSEQAQNKPKSGCAMLILLVTLISAGLSVIPFYG